MAVHGQLKVGLSIQPEPPTRRCRKGKSALGIHMNDEGLILGLLHRR